MLSADKHVQRFMDSQDHVWNTARSHGFADGFFKGVIVGIVLSGGAIITALLMGWP